MYQYKANLIRVIDGDTLVLECDLGFYIKTQMAFRLAYIDTAELNSSDPAQRELANKAKAYVESVLTTDPKPTIVIHTAKPDKYGRWLCVLLYTTSTGEQHCLNDELLLQGLAKRY